MDSGAAAAIAEDLAASFTGLAVVLRGGEGSSGSRDADPLRRRADIALKTLAGVARAEPRMAALKVHAAACFAETAQIIAGPAESPQEHTAQETAVVAEVACVLTVSERDAGALVSESYELTTSLPLTLAALEAGTISWQHARIMVDETANLDKPVAAALETHFLDPEAVNPARGCPAGELVASRFRHKARIWRERHHPVSIETRHARGLADRRLDYRPDRDGMAWLSAYLPADQAAGIWDRTTTAARALQGPDESRTLSQLRADTAATWLLGNNTSDMTGMTGGTGAASSAEAGPAAGMTGETIGTAGEAGLGVPSPRAQVLVTVPVLSLLGLTDEPALLDGYGPVPPSMARQLVADGAESFHRVLVDPRDGAPLEIGRTSYRVTKAQRQWLRLRDGKCPFPGCRNQSLDNEADHILAWAHGGTTGILNLGGPCPKHHRLRHTSAWTPTPASKHEPPGWISPSGRRYASEHPDWEPPVWPANIPITGTGTNADPDLDLDLELDLYPGLPSAQDATLNVDPGTPKDPLKDVSFPDDPYPDGLPPKDPVLAWGPDTGG